MGASVSECEKSVGMNANIVCVCVCVWGVWVCGPALTQVCVQV